MNESMRLLLKKKYGLVHVPNQHKCAAWVDDVQQRIRSGEPAEAAGAAAARALFPYEYKPRAQYGGPSIDQIISAAASPG
ncbi:MAG: hypothetical protein EA403_12620 [Spirochaetaceae bacterium]|nr:MAG: hypothetical protein EA403_12620 [Spirochaetaceae bacterium]